MAGRRLNRKAVTCRTATSRTVAIADHAPTPALRLSALTIPTTEANPTISVIAISVEEKVPETIRAQPSRNSQIKIISISQKTKHGSAAHLIQPERRMPRTMEIQSGDVCTMCRRTPCDTAPTTSKATIVDTEQATKMRKSRSKSHPAEAFILSVRSAVSQPDALASLVSPDNAQTGQVSLPPKPSCLEWDGKRTVLDFSRS